MTTFGPGFICTNSRQVPDSGTSTPTLSTPGVDELRFPDDFFRHPLSDGEEEWGRYFRAAATTGREHFALLEFVRADSPDSVRDDAKTLCRLAGNANA